MICVKNKNKNYSGRFIYLKIT